MEVISVQQSSPQWAAHRATHFNASDCAAMLGVCPYKTRERLLYEKKTGIQPSIGHYKKAIFERGHQFEEWAREIAEHHIEEELFPCVGVLEGTKLSASFDGLTMDRSVVWEHKFLSNGLRESIESRNELPLHYRVQLEQQLLVSGASKAVFMASYWSEDGQLLEKYTRDYFPDKELRQRIIQGWQQFEKDLADYEVKEAPEPKVETNNLPVLPPLQFAPQGDLYFSSNLTHFKQEAVAVLNSINRELLEESDFAQAEIVVKWCKKGEDQLAGAQTKLIENTPLHEMLGTMKSIQEQMRDIRLDLDKQVKAEKARVKQGLMDQALIDIKAHYRTANVEYEEDAPIIARMESAIKGLKNLDKMQNAIDRVVIAEKTALTQRLEKGYFSRLIQLDDINQAMAPLSISNEGLRQLGFVPVTTDKSAKLYKAADFSSLIHQLIAHLSTAKLPEPLAETA